MIYTSIKEQVSTIKFIENNVVIRVQNIQAIHLISKLTEN